MKNNEIKVQKEWGESSKIKTTLGFSLHKAFNVINGERQDKYGAPEDSFQLIAKYWNVYLSNKENNSFVPLTALDVAHMMILFKLSRCSGQESNEDNYIDIEGYAAIAVDRLLIIEETNDKNITKKD